MSIQKRLNDLYTEYLNKILSDKDIYDKILNFSISSPLFLDSNVDFGQYLDSAYRILYVGQETNYWFNRDERKKADFYDSIEDIEKYRTTLLELYKTFNLGLDYDSEIFQFMNILISEFREKNNKTGILWTNILRHDSFGKGRVSPDIEKKITYNQNYIFQKEVEILAPDAIVFVTGPMYDNVIENTYNGLEKTQIGDYPIKEMCIFKHKKLPKKSLRVYHPNYYKYKGAEYRWDLSSKIIELIET